MTEIEQQIAAALNGGALSSDELGNLITDTEAAIIQAERASELERKRALDPLLSPDPTRARQAMEGARFAAERLRTMLPKLQRHHQQVAARETYAGWVATFDALKPKHAAAASKLKAIYNEFVPKLIEALTEAKQVDEEVRRVAALKPSHLPQANGDGRNLPTVECTARGVTGVSPDFSLMTVKLPAFDAPNQLAWPPYEVPLAVQVAASMIPVATDPRQYTGDWWQVQQERAQALREQQLREQQERQAEADASYPGPRWWERTGS